MPGDELPDRDLWHPPQIVGRLVALRRPEPDDVDAVVRWYRDPELARLTRYQTRPMTQAEVERFFQTRMLAPGRARLRDRRAAHVAADRLHHVQRARRRQRLGHVPHHDRRARRVGPRLGHRGDRADGRPRLRATRAAPRGPDRLLLQRARDPRLREGRLLDRGPAARRDPARGHYFDEVQMGILADEWLERRYGQLPLGEADEALVR